MGPGRGSETQKGWLCVIYGGPVTPPSVCEFRRVWSLKTSGGDAGGDLSRLPCRWRGLGARFPHPRSGGRGGAFEARWPLKSTCRFSWRALMLAPPTDGGGGPGRFEELRPVFLLAENLHSGHFFQGAP
ncbi:unnamed protein product [Rangifer tarandus platyrhynchus]|uniref:Uncharacterized protein n=2 Tax=Rangifer tarandus platyrhynchus TaxID=3082113 RepID=A0ABN9A514_RANTA|nr:unnamed protein product [Rangifer tarandus platyrhynchus]